MLLGQDLRGSHDTSLEVVVNGNEHRHQGHQGLTTSHITLQQPVHLASGTHILAYLFHYLFLGPR